MISRYRQLHRHAPDEGLIGDCWRTCIACILGLKPQQVPHFVEQAVNAGRKTDGYHVELANEWLAKRGFGIISIALRADAPSIAFSMTPGIHYILGGSGSAGLGVHHCVVGEGHFQTAWDPSPWATGPLTPLTDANGAQYYWLEFIVPINLATNPENP